MEKLRTKKDILGVIGVIVAIAAGATLPIVLSATAGAHGAPSKPIPVADCSPPTDSSNLPVAAFSPPICTPVLTATPSTGLGDGQTIAISATGYSANAAVGVVECQAGATGPAGCDLGTLLYEQSNGNGDFASPYTVTRILSIGQKNGKSKTIDCAKKGCFLGAADIANFSVASFVPITFDPSIPLLLTGTLDHAGIAHAKAGVADITGTIGCTHPLTAYIYVDLTQLYGRFVFRSEGETLVSCKSGTKTWTVKVPPGNGTYAPGVATAGVGIQAQTGTGYRNIQISGKVHLKAGK
ncbi:MAG TPA: neocarzinostatin apoprotein domain-containing protein [Acidimicrobiales bacterium]|nr:neocarzinostatin apoprotein domain-containing protein [Acidimicrobiales bacterium]